MAAIPVTLDGVVYDLYNRTTQRVIFFGDASLTGLGPGGGPIVPPPGGGTQPPGGGQPPHPAFPIAGPPGSGFPDKPGYPPTAEHPIVKPPDEGTKPPDPVQPPIEWKAVWHPEEGWMVVGVPNVPHPTPSS
jgi:hypothetical protein